MAGLHARTPVYVTSLELANVRCFGDRQKLDLTDGHGRPAPWTLILGDNNVGKTTLLQCLAWMRPRPQLSLGITNASKAKLGPALTNEENDVLESLIRIEGRRNLAAELIASFGPGQGSNPGARSPEIRTRMKIFGKQGKLDRIDSGPLGASVDLNEYRKQELRVIVYGANRGMGSQNLGRTDLQDPGASRLSGLTELYDASEILEKLDHTALKEEKESKHVARDKLERFKVALAGALPDLAPDDIQIFAPQYFTAAGQASGVKFRTFSGLVGLSQLSLGYQTMIAWTLDLAWRLSEIYPTSANPLAEPAVVIVDEIDLHLHPKWQRSVIRRLTDLFRGTQFIATAHSPMMAQAAAEDNIVVLEREGDQVIINSDPLSVRGWRIDQIATSELFGVTSARDENIERLVKERDAILDKPRRTRKDLRRLEQLGGVLDALPTAETKSDNDAMDTIRKAAAELRKR